jgi:hypothetical protein
VRARIWGLLFGSLTRETRYKKQHSGALAPSRSVFGLLGTRRVDLLNCLDDEAATERASLLAKEHPVEVWDGNRLITTIKPHPEH